MAQNNNAQVTRLEFEIVKDDIKELHKVYDLIQRQIIATEKLALEIKYLREDQKDANARIKALEERPNKRYDTIVTQIISNIIALTIGVIAAIIGLKK
jgi:hypothetical protein